MKFSIIVPVFNRPDEVDELLESLTHQSVSNFEVIIVEDGSSKPCSDICKKYESILDIHYYYKENSGPGQSRNYGAERAQGEYLLILDSDVVLPENYIRAIDEELGHEPADAFGGPDRAHDSFTDTQKAISYSMTSFFTTGGIRGGKKKLDKFYPRSFNMGIRKDVYTRLGDSPRCVLVKTSTLVSESSRRDTDAVCFRKLGSSISVAPTSRNSSVRCTTVVLPESTCIRNIRRA